MPKDRTLILPTSPTMWGNQCGLDDRDWHTQPRMDHCSQEGRTTIGPCCVPGSDIATVWTCPTPVYTPHREAMHKQHTEPRPSGCVAFGDPHVHKVARSNDTRQECTHSTAKALGTSPPSGEDTPDDDQSKGRKRRGYISKEFCANTDLCPLASPRVALAGVRLLRHPDKGNTR